MSRKEQIALFLMLGRDYTFIKAQVETSTKFIDEIKIEIKQGKFKYLVNGK